ncbi:MAG: TIGR03960 family B12-binding radical SAM protein [Chloroflexota bacterium]|jgi:radical SAM family uncharacterized protein|nr:TIGR03960 family B12-binding radical SAM protein [Chloroflexota bacterium]MDP6756758.1 TIGR03960 family B12-binding radical SAM protein [Chloroflexota bacterium]
MAQYHRLGVDALLARVNSPAHYAGGEWNSRNKDWDAAAVRLCLAFPDTYEIGMSNLGIQILYEIVNEMPDALCDRAFTPWPDMAEVLRETGNQLFGLESRRPLSEFDAVGFSLPYELGASNILEMLDLGGVAVLAAERGPDDPIVIGGGASLVNPEPLADFFDLIVIGEGEEILPALLAELRDLRSASPDWRSAFLKTAAAREGVYVPGFYAPVYGPDYAYVGIEPRDPSAPPEIRRLHVDIDHHVRPLKPLVASTETVFDRASVEIHRGCARGCRFCQAGFIDRPVRTRSPENVRRLADSALVATGHRDLTLLSLSAADYRGVDDLIGAVRGDADNPHLRVNIPSTRVDAFNVKLAGALQESRRGSLTFAPEAATERLREVIHKGISEEDLLRTAELAFSSGWQALKLYFMIGLPTEEMADVEAIVRLSNKVLQVGRKHRGGRARVRVGVSTFVPKPHTPFQWFPQASIEEIIAKQDVLRQGLRDRAIKLNWNDPEHSSIEALLSLGDRRVGRAVKRAWELGAKLDSWDEWHEPEIWKQACRETDVGLDWFIHRHRAEDEVMPWGHVRIHTRPWVLRWEYDRALADARGDQQAIPTAAYTD